MCKHTHVAYFTAHICSPAHFAQKTFVTNAGTAHPSSSFTSSILPNTSVRLNIIKNLCDGILFSHEFCLHWGIRKTFTQLCIFTETRPLQEHNAVTGAALLCTNNGTNTWTIINCFHCWCKTAHVNQPSSRGAINSLQVTDTFQKSTFLSKTQTAAHKRQA